MFGPAQLCNMASQKAKRTVRAFAAASFLNDMGSDMIKPIWPLFLTAVLGANMAALGLVDGIGKALVSMSQAFSGYLSDRLKRRKAFIWFGYLLGGLSRIGYALSPAWQWLIPFKITDRFGKMRDAPRDAIVADVSGRGNRGGNFGLIRAMDHLGAVTGIVIAILLFSLIGYRNIFLLAAVPSGIGALLVFSMIKERKVPHVKLHKGIALKDLGRDYRLFLLSAAVFALGSFSYSFLLIFAKEFGYQATVVPVLYLVFTALAFLSSIPFGRAADRMGRKPLMMASFGLWALVSLTFLLSQSWYAIAVAFVLYGAHLGSLQTVQRTFVSELSPLKFRASGIGTFRMVVGLCALPASVVAGLLWETYGLFAPFALSLALTLAAMGLLLLVREK